MKIDYGPGYRIYYKDTGKEIIRLTLWWRQINTGARHYKSAKNRKIIQGGLDYESRYKKECYLCKI